MVPAQPAHVMVARKLKRLRFQRCAHRRKTRVRQRKIAIVRHEIQRRTIPQRVDSVAQHLTRATNCVRTKARAGAVGRRAIVSNASDGVRAISLRFGSREKAVFG